LATGELEPFALRGLTPTDPIAAAADVRASAEDVWAVISEPGNLDNVHPFCASNEVERWSGVGSRDRIRYHSGVLYEREALAWVDGVGYDLTVGPPPGPIAVARWRIDPADGADRCRITIEVTSFVRSDVTVEVRERYERSVIRGAIPPYLDSVVRGVAWYSETGTPVQRNQFGAHDVYSPAVD
jgi:hypothetical protein